MCVCVCVCVSETTLPCRLVAAVLSSTHTVVLKQVFSQHSLLENTARAVRSWSLIPSRRHCQGCSFPVPEAQAGLFGMPRRWNQLRWFCGNSVRVCSQNTHWYQVSAPLSCGGRRWCLLWTRRWNLHPVISHPEGRPVLSLAYGPPSGPCFPSAWPGASLPCSPLRLCGSAVFPCTCRLQPPPFEERVLSVPRGCWAR